MDERLQVIAGVEITYMITMQGARQSGLKTGVRGYGFKIWSPESSSDGGT